MERFALYLSRVAVATPDGGLVLPVVARPGTMTDSELSEADVFALSERAYFILARVLGPDHPDAITKRVQMEQSTRRN